MVSWLPAQDRVLAEWRFDTPGDFQGWVANGHLADVTVTNGVLSGRSIGSDPILEYRPPLNLAASPWQIIELRFKADHDGFAQFFWSNTSEGRYGGFDGGKTTDFNIIGDGQWQVYRLMPFWQKEGQIVRLRFDLPGGMTFALDSLRILEIPATVPATIPSFDFADGLKGWRAMEPARAWTTHGGMAVQTRGAGDFALGPPVRVDAQEMSFITLRLTATQGRQGRIFFATDREHGLHSLAFPIKADGREHFYNVDMLAAKEWAGRVVALGLQPTDATDTAATVRSLAVAAEPQGPPQLAALTFSLEEAAPRIGVSAAIVAVIANTGGSQTTNLRAELTLPEGLNRITAPIDATLQTPLGYGDEMRLEWRVEATKPLTNEVRLLVTADHAEPLVQRAPVKFTTRPTPGALVARSANLPAVPQPQPVRGKYDVGVYYFPGWKSASQWQPIQRFPERKPVLGWYREGEPEVADWHIKWAVEHGITFFAYDWYWVKGARQLEHGLHDGYFKAHYQNLLKFCLLWANHNPPNTHSLEDSRAVTRFWITNYFQRPEYYRIDGKPVVIIFSPHNYRTDLGTDGVNQAFAAMREECRRAGLPGLYLMACVNDPRQVAEETYDAVTAYNWPGLGMNGTEKRAPFAPLVDAYRRQWEAFLTKGSQPIMLPVCGGWDSRPWHGDAALVRHDRTPALFKKHLQDAREMLDGRPTHSNLLKAVLIEAWNEWGEGSYIEPHKEYGFEYLDAIREVFTDAPKAHPDLAPVDAGLGPYEVLAEPPGRTAWTFNQSAEGWDNPMHCEAVKTVAGILTTTTTGDDPALFGPPMQAPAAAFTRVLLRLRLSPADGRPARDTAQLFWRTRRWAESEACSVRFPVEVDSQWHDYELKVAGNPRWKGIVTRLRLDVGARAGVKVELDDIGLSR